MINNSGPRTEPWGTPFVSEAVADLLYVDIVLSVVDVRNEPGTNQGCQYLKTERSVFYSRLCQICRVDKGSIKMFINPW